MYPINTPFEWDIYKAAANFRKHGISFADAVHALYDPDGFYGLDLEHSRDNQEREFCIGLAKQGILIVIFIELHEGARVRIISARRAINKEIQHYYEK